MTEKQMPTDDELLSGKDKELWFKAEALWEADHPKVPSENALRRHDIARRLLSEAVRRTQN